MTAARTQTWTLAATILGSSMSFIDGSAVNVALPAMQHSLDMSIDGAQWVVAGYLLTLGAFVLVGGAAGDRYGRRLVFLIGAAAFAVASIACGIAPNTAFLIGARVAQGIAGALLVPGSLAIITSVFPEAERGRAIGTWAGASGLTTALGPVLGGWLVDVSTWRSIFYINVPLALLVIAIGILRVPESRGAPAIDARLDWVGGGLAVVALGAVSFGLTAAVRRGWGDPAVYGAIVVGLAVLAAFVAFEARVRSPMVPLHLFRSRVFSGMNLLTLLLYGALAGTFFFLPFDLIHIHGYSAAEAGASFLPFVLIFGILSRWSGALVARFGARMMLTVGPAIIAIGIMMLAIPGVGGSYWATFFPGLLVFGAGMAIAVAPLTATVIGAVDHRLSGTASGINNAVSRVAGLLVVAVMGSVAAGAFAAGLDDRLAALHTPAPVRAAVEAEAPKLADARVPDMVALDARPQIDTALKDSFVRAFRVVILANGALALLAALCGLAAPARRPRPE